MIADPFRACLPFATPTNKRPVWNLWAMLFPPVIVALAVLAMVSPELTAAWELERSAVAHGEWRRLITGHLTHWSIDHLFWDAATFLALGLACMRRRPAATMVCTLIGSLAISVTVLAVHDQVEAYRGLSGLDTALFTLLAAMIYQDAKRDGDRALGAVAKWGLAALVAKTAYEVATGDTLFVDSQQAAFVPLASAHAVGAAVGLLTAVAPAIRGLILRSPSSSGGDVIAFCPRRAILRKSRFARAAGE